MRRKSGPIRVMVVEDSPTARNLLVALFNQSGDIQVAGTALDGVEAVRRAAELRPDVITMDIHMPRLNGLEATRQILQIAPIPIVIVTASVNRSDMDLSFEAMRAGALSVVKKPSLGDMETCEQFIQTVRLMADVPVVRRWNKENGKPVTRPVSPAEPAPLAPTSSSATIALASKLSARGGSDTGAYFRKDPKNPWKLIGIASSTGGPSALVSALKTLPADFPLPILVVQHITRGFAGSLAQWLDGELNLSVRVAEQGEIPLPGSVLISPDDCHMQVSDRGTILLHNSPPYKGLRPSANYLFFSLARVFGKRAIGIILTGMGDDGVEGLSELHNQGGLVLAQDEASSVVYGMPREAAARKVVDHILPVDRFGQTLLQLSEQGG
jgi:two-component system, chemotaxis family, protein-glutamate methylesterase/glutaminase